jgi:8-oxo-dGTP diphosphatase
MILVTCAVIIQNNKLLSVQRGTGRHLAGKWEFPGGKVQEGERLEDSVVREVREELDLAVEVISALTPVTHAYPDRTVRLMPFHCRVTNGTLHLHEHQAHRWLSADELTSVEWCDADGPIIEEARKLVAP